MSEPHTIPRIDTEPGCPTARGPHLRSLRKFTIPPSPATKLLFVLLILVVAMWVISHIREFNVVVILGQQAYLLEQRDGAAYFAADDTGALSSDVGGVHVMQTSTILLIFGADDCGEHVVLGAGYRADELGMKILHLHHWLLTTLIALLLAYSWLHQMTRRRIARPRDIKRAIAILTVSNVMAVLIVAVGSGSLRNRLEVTPADIGAFIVLLCGAALAGRHYRSRVLYLAFGAMSVLLVFFPFHGNAEAHFFRGGGMGELLSLWLFTVVTVSGLCHFAARLPEMIRS